MCFSSFLLYHLGLNKLPDVTLSWKISTVFADILYANDGQIINRLQDNANNLFMHVFRIIVCSVVLPDKGRVHIKQSQLF